MLQILQIVTTLMMDIYTVRIMKNVKPVIIGSELELVQVHNYSFHLIIAKNTLHNKVLQIIGQFELNRNSSTHFCKVAKFLKFGLFTKKKIIKNLKIRTCVQRMIVVFFRLLSYTNRLLHNEQTG